jgi:nucleoside-diphosphate-sugar epimerase
MKLFVTGATGFIGSHFVQAALLAGNHVTALRHSENSKTRIALKSQPAWLSKSMPEVGASDFQGHDVLVHLAAVGVDLQSDWAECFRVNVDESLSLWTKAADAGIRHFVICGSCFEYGRSGERYEFIPPDAPLEPVAAYAASKAAATMAALGLASERQLSLLVARPFHVFGEGEAETRLWPSLRRAAFEGMDFEMTPAQQVRDFVPVEEVANQLVVACRENTAPGKPAVLNIGTGQPSTLQNFAEHWWGHWNATGRLMLGAKSYRAGEVMRYVPRVTRSTVTN